MAIKQFMGSPTAAQQQKLVTVVAEWLKWMIKKWKKNGLKNDLKEALSYRTNTADPPPPPTPLQIEA